MKRFRYFSMLLLLFAAAFYACRDNDPNPPDDPDEDSPGVDEYFRMNTGTELWETDTDKDLGIVILSFGNTAKISMSATRKPDSTHCLFNVPYFYAADTVISSSASDNFGFQFHYNNNTYTDCGGTFSIQRSLSGSIEVYDGTFNMLFSSVFPTGDTLNLANGSFRIARVI